jgi:hypothetical protein
LVDLACGRGGPGLWLARAAGAALTGVDFSAVAVAQAAGRAALFGMAANTEFVVGDPALSRTRERHMCWSCGVARGGVEPPTFRFSGGRSYQLSYLAGAVSAWLTARGGDPDGTRTRDLRRDRAAR